MFTFGAPAMAPPAPAVFTFGRGGGRSYEDYSDDGE